MSSREQVADANAHDTLAGSEPTADHAGPQPEVAAAVRRLGPGDAGVLAQLLAAHPTIARTLLSVAAGHMGNAAVQRAIAMASGSGAGNDEQTATSNHSIQGPAHGRVTASALNVRQSADATSHGNIVGGLHHGDAIDVVGREGAWIKIRYHGGEAFVHGGFVEITPTAPAAPRVAPTAPAGHEGAGGTHAPAPVPSPKAIEVVKDHAPAPVAHAPSPSPAPVAHAPTPAPAPTPFAHAPAPAPAPTPVAHAPTPAPAPAPVAHAPTPAPAPAPAPVAHAPTPAPVAHAPTPDHRVKLQAESDALVRELDAGHIDQAEGIRRFIAFDSQGGHGMTPEGMELLSPLMGALAAHEVQRLRTHSQAGNAPGGTAPNAPVSNAPHVAPGGKEAQAGVQTWTPPAAAVLGDAGLEGLAANVHDPKVAQLLHDLAGVVTLHDTLFKHRTAKEFTGTERENLVAGIAVVHAELAALDGGNDPAHLAAFKVAVNHKLEEASPYHSQINIRTIETGQYTTCNVTSLAMALEATGRNADSYKAAKLPALLAVAQMYSGDVAKATMTSHGNTTSFESLRGLRLPDFMEFAAIAHYLSGATPTPEEIKAAAIKAAGTKTHIDFLAGVAGDFGATANAEYMSFGGAAGNKALESYADSHHAQADSIADARNAGDKATYAKLSAQTPLEGGAIEDQVPLAAYKAKVMATIKPQIDAGAGIISGTYNHFTRCFGVSDEHVMVQDPGQFKRSERMLLWPEARALRYFWNYVVIK